jgi:RNA polymerase sigma factor (sigma-70 family)
MEAVDDDLVRLTTSIRRTLLARCADRELVDDLTQETLAKVTAVRDRFDDHERLRGYAIVTARNALAQHHRQQRIALRHAHRLVDRTAPDAPDETSVQREEADALGVALEHLDEADRTLLIEHEVRGTSLADLAELRNTTTRALGMRLARTRATLRVEYVVAVRHMGELRAQCRNVLVALSTGDVRRQRELGAADHVLRCPTCSQLSGPVVERRRGMAAWLILPIVHALRRFVGSLRHNRTTQAATAAVVVAAIAVGGLVAQQRGSTASPPGTADAAVDARPVATSPIATGPGASGTGIDGSPLEVSSAEVIDVPADEGFWMSVPDGEMWVHLVGTAESPQQVLPGQRVALVGTVRVVGDDPTQAGIVAADAARLAQRGTYVEVPYDALTIETPPVP